MDERSRTWTMIKNNNDDNQTRHRKDLIKTFKIYETVQTKDFRDESDHPFAY